MAGSAQGRKAQARIAELESALEVERVERRAAQARIVELELEFKKERAQFALAERAGRVGYWRMTLPEMQKAWSPGMYALLNLDPEAAIPSIDSFIPNGNIGGTHSYETDGVRSYLEKRSVAIRTHSSFSERTRVRCADGSERIIDTFGEPEIGPDGHLVAMVGACHDVTEQVLIETERNKAQELFQIMMDAASDIITIYRMHDGKTETEFASAGLARMLGWTLQNLESDAFFKCVHPDDVGEAAKLQDSAQPGRSVTATYRVRHADGHYVWIEGTFNTVYDEATGSILYRVGIARDVTERKAYEEAVHAARISAEAANQAKSAFLANMSHELRTPLNAIIGFADVMGREMFGPIENARYRDYVSSIHKSGRHLLDLINDILDVAKIEAGKVTLNLEDFNLAETVRECTRTMAERAASADVELNASLPASDLFCRADRRAVTQIILNLLSNAVKFTPRGGHVDIAATIIDEQVRIEVRDDGIGIAAEDLPRLAKPFEQVCDDPNLAKNGTGLGLALVRALAEHHGGHLSIDSPAQKGTIVTVELPRHAVEHEVAA